jgi:hypothetical protein
MPGFSPHTGTRGLNLEHGGKSDMCGLYSGSRLIGIH